MKKKIKKLNLVRTTVAHLRNGELEKIQGGDKTNGHTCFTHKCQTLLCSGRTCF